MIFSRQIYLKAAAGEPSQLADSGPPLFEVRDVPADVRLVSPGAQTGYVSVPATGSVSLSLPVGYASTVDLFVLLRCEGVIKVTLVSPDHLDSVSLVKGTAAIPGTYSVSDTVTSLTLANPTATAINVRYALVTMPDLLLGASYLYQFVTLGYNNGV